MRKHHFLLAAVSCFFLLQACQKDSIAPLPESTAITTATTNDSPFFNINTVEDLATIEQLLTQNEIATSRSKMKVVHVPGGSTNAIQAAIDEVGPYGTVILEAGNHTEEQTILITKPVFIVGRAEATVLASGGLIEEAGLTQPLFFITQTNRVSIWGVTMQGKEGGSAIGVEIVDATRSVIANNTMSNFQSNIAIQKGDHTLAWRNTIVGITTDLNGAIFPSTGIGVSVGQHIRILQNKITNCWLAIIVSSKNGTIQGNELFGNNTGIDLDFIPPIFPLANGELFESDCPATNWTIQNNYAHDNMEDGYAIFAGSNNNKLLANRGDNNGFSDLFLSLDDFNVAGLPSPASFDNFIDTGNNKDFVIMDCGNTNEIVGGKLLPCIF